MRNMNIFASWICCGPRQGAEFLSYFETRKWGERVVGIINKPFGYSPKSSADEVAFAKKLRVKKD